MLTIIYSLPKNVGESVSNSSYVGNLGMIIKNVGVPIIFYVLTPKFITKY